eukprot:2985702-Pleurochrysis_carterae.AAC.1
MFQVSGSHPPPPNFARNDALRSFSSYTALENSELLRLTASAKSALVRHLGSQIVHDAVIAKVGTAEEEISPGPL